MGENVLLLSADALRADHVGWHGYERDTTPVLDGIARESVRYERAYSASCHTREAVPSILTGRYPDDAVAGFYRLDCPSVAVYLRKAGYDTAAAVAAPFLVEATGYDRGFDRFRSTYELSGSVSGVLLEYAADIATNSHFASGEVVNDHLLSAIDDLEEPFFAWGHYMETHGPYNRFGDPVFGDAIDPRRLQLLYRRAKYRPSSIDADERRTLVDAYDDSIRRFDAAMESLFSGLRERDLLAETTVILTADHGEAFGENGYYEHVRHLEEELLHVPLLVREPDGDPATVSRKVSTVDVAPTILERAGVGGVATDGVPLARETERTIRCTFRRGISRQQRVL